MHLIEHPNPEVARYALQCVSKVGREGWRDGGGNVRRKDVVSRFHVIRSFFLSPSLPPSFPPSLPLSLPPSLDHGGKLGAYSIISSGDGRREGGRGGEATVVFQKVWIFKEEGGTEEVRKGGREGRAPPPVGF